MFFQYLRDMLKRNAEAREAKRKVAREATERAWAKRSKAAKKAAVTRKRNAERRKVERELKEQKWETRKPKLYAIAEKVFSEIDKFSIDLDDGELTFSVNGRNLRYEKSLTRTYKSILAEMEEDKNRPSPEDDYYIPRCSICRIRPVQMRVSGIRYRHGDVCMSCDDDEC